MATRLGPVIVKFCDTCNSCSQHIPSSPVHLNIVPAQGKQTILHKKAPTIFKEDVIAAIKTAVAENISQGAASIYYDPQSATIKVEGSVREYTHECRQIK